MITECRIWRGAHPMLYGEDLRDWTAQEVDTFSQPIRLDAAQLKATSLEVSRAFVDDGGFFGGVRTIVVQSAQEWTAADYKDLIKHLKEADTAFRMSFVFESGKPPKAITDVATDELDYQVPKGKELKTLPAWLVDQFKRMDVRADKATLTKLVDYVGEDTNAVVDVVAGMRRYAGQKIGWAEIESQLGERGSVAMYQLTGVIATGDIEKSMDMLDRLQGKVHELAMMKLLSNRYELYLRLVDSRRPLAEIAELTGKNEWALKQASGEAKKLGKDRAIKSFLMIAETERDMKGGRPVSADYALRQLVIRLTRLFELAQRH